MQKLSEFFRSAYAPAFLDSKDPRTFAEYQTSVRLCVEFFDDPDIKEIGLLGAEFVRRLRDERELKPYTIKKHVGNINAILKALGPKSDRCDTKHFGKLDYTPSFPVPKCKPKLPKVPTDFEFQQLYRAFGSEEDYPQFLPRNYRPAFWRGVGIIGQEEFKAQREALDAEFLALKLKVSGVSLKLKEPEPAATPLAEAVAGTSKKRRLSKVD